MGSPLSGDGDYRSGLSEVKVNHPIVPGHSPRWFGTFEVSLRK